MIVMVAVFVMCPAHRGRLRDLWRLRQESLGPGDYGRGVIITAAQIDNAVQTLAPVMRRTPVVASRALSDLCGGDVWLKCENLQRTGSFKPRGAYVRITGLSDDERARGVVAASAGNHAQGVAWSATTLGIPARVYMPTGASLPKVSATRAYGAEVVLSGAIIDESLVEAQQYAAETGAVLIHPFDHEDIVAGQATVGVEILQQMPDVGTVVVPLGGGGLLAGVAAAIKVARPDVRVIGVQAESGIDRCRETGAGGVHVDDGRRHRRGHARRRPLHPRGVARRRDRHRRRGSDQPRGAVDVGTREAPRRAGRRGGRRGPDAPGRAASVRIGVRGPLRR
ncbi:hypothetical protein GCM10009722_05780 [Williamsia deligens]